MTLTAVQIGCLVGMVVALVYVWLRLRKSEQQYQDICMAAAVITLHNGKQQGNVFTLTSPFGVPACDYRLMVTGREGELRMLVELQPTERRRKREPAPDTLEPDVAAALA